MDGQSMPAGFSVSVRASDFDLSAESARLIEGNTKIGAVVSFVGLVRGSAETVSRMELEHYPGMTEKALAGILTDARARWPLDAARIIHRIGPLEPGEQIVLVLAASRHRRAAFEAAEFIMDFLKTAAPFWKREQGIDGAKWVDARDSDDAAIERWSR